MSGKWVEIARTSSVEETQACAAALAGVLDAGAVVTLDGDLGAGKTHFTQGLAAALGVAQAVTSPTFNLVVEYTDGRLPLYQLEDLAFYEYVEGDGVSCIEWASKFPEEMPEDRLEVYLAVEGENVRAIRACAHGSAESMLQSWRAALA